MALEQNARIEKLERENERLRKQMDSDVVDVRRDAVNQSLPLGRRRAHMRGNDRM